MGPTTLIARIGVFLLLLGFYLANGWVWLAGFDLDGLIKFAMLYASAAASGVVLRRAGALRPVRVLAVSAAIVAGLVLWTPLVLATYGFALLGLPLPLLYGAAVSAAWRLADRYFA